MPTFYFLLIFGQVAVVAAAAAVLYFLGAKPSSRGAGVAERSPNADAKRVTHLFSEIGNTLAFHGRALLGANRPQEAGDEGEAALQRAANLATLRHCNRETNRSLQEHNAELGDLMKHYGGLYRSEQCRLDAYAAKTQQLNQAIGAAGNPSAEDAPELAQLVQEMRQENDRLRVKVADCQSQAAELIAQAVRSDREARVDALTQLPNRRAWEEQLQRIRGADAGYLALADVDRFKEVNDQYGHPAGDAMLTLLGTLLGDLPEVSAFRIGGDEFGLLLPGVTPDRAHQILEAVRTRIQRSTVRHQGLPLNVTISLGAAPSGTSASVETVVEQADRALYTAKRAGGDRLHFSVDGPQSDFGTAQPAAETL